MRLRRPAAGAGVGGYGAGQEGVGQKIRPVGDAESVNGGLGLRRAPSGGERLARLRGQDSRQLPVGQKTGGQPSIVKPSTAGAEGQFIGVAEGKAVAGVEVGESALGVEILRVLRQAGADVPAENGRDIVDGLRKSVGGQEATPARHALLRAELHRVVRTGGARLNEQQRRKLGIGNGAGIGTRLVQVARARQMRALGSDIGQVDHPVRPQLIL